MADAHQAVWDALSGLPRPITEAVARATADEVLAALGTGLNVQFLKWFDQNGEALLRRLNGG